MLLIKKNMRLSFILFCPFRDKATDNFLSIAAKGKWNLMLMLAESWDHQLFKLINSISYLIILSLSKHIPGKLVASRSITTIIRKEILQTS